MFKRSKRFYFIVFLLWLLPSSLLFRSFYAEKHWNTISEQYKTIELLKKEIKILEQKHDQITAKIMSAQSNIDVTEEAARWNLGLVRDGEIFYEFSA